jgi:ribosome maturation factor RimP
MEDIEARLWGLIEPYVAAEGVELDDLVVRGGGGARLVRVTVDAAGGMDVEAIARLSQGLSRVLDEADALPGTYTLEVGSPGLERDLRRPAHFRKSLGREATVATRDEVAGARRHRGLIDEVAAEGVTLLVGEEKRRIHFDQVTQARTVFRWEKPPKPGRKRG